MSESELQRRDAVLASVAASRNRRDRSAARRRLLAQSSRDVLVTTLPSDRDRDRTHA